MALSRYIVLDKSVGRTPLETLEKWRQEHSAYAGVPATYAGRLDPMASGKLLILLGDECAKRERYTGLDKEYEIEVVLDLSTDTGDALGLPHPSPQKTRSTLAEAKDVLASLSGTHAVPYPAFSSKTVNGKPLFQYALEGALDTIDIPVHDETVYRSKLIQRREMTALQLQERLREILKKVPRSDEPSKALGADFRQDAVRAAWNVLLGQMAGRTFTVVSLHIVCSSGTYMRTFAVRLGDALGTSGFALSIHRTKIGRYLPMGPLGLWIRRYA